ncbi:ArsR family transcriptional regulator [filamentous cyanobacterium CCP5]|nr:ArsR family transcriptional regulator [filamentous cyanobacterium CCP5]
MANEPPFERLADRFRLLSDPSRLRILSIICQGERNVTEICAMTGLHQANVSKHLQLLKAAGAVACRRVGSCRHYRIIDDDLLALCPRSSVDI